MPFNTKEKIKYHHIKHHLYYQPNHLNHYNAYPDFEHNNNQIQIDAAGQLYNNTNNYAYIIYNDGFIGNNNLINNTE